MNTISLTQIGNTHSRWLRSLEFYKLEIGILTNMLGEIAKKSKRGALAKDVTYYEGLLKQQVDSIDTLSREIKDSFAKVNKQAQTATAGYIDSSLLTAHDRLEEKFEAEEKVINELRAAFHHFAADWM